MFKLVVEANGPQPELPQPIISHEPAAPTPLRRPRRSTSKGKDEVKKMSSVKGAPSDKPPHSPGPIPSAASPEHSSSHVGRAARPERSQAATQPAQEASSASAAAPISPRKLEKMPATAAAPSEPKEEAGAIPAGRPEKPPHAGGGKPPVPPLARAASGDGAKAGGPSPAAPLPAAGSSSGGPSPRSPRAPQAPAVRKYAAAAGGGKEEGGAVAARTTETEGVSFYAGNPSVEVVTGVLHLYRERPGPGEHVDGQLPHGRLPAIRSNVLAVLAVPASMAPADFCVFICSYLNTVSHMRILRDSSPNKYMAVVTFTDQASADRFYRDLNGKTFTALEPETVHVVYVADMQFTSPSEAGAAPLPPPGQTELPTCPVCLERLDSAVSGILTILCNHSFHCSCLSKWGDSSCPVCRYCQEPAAGSACDACGAREDLWICLICGAIGCGRYSGSHAYAHFTATAHCYAMETVSQRVWDYAGDGYVHRLIQNRADGKLVELSAPAGPAGRGRRGSGEAAAGALFGAPESESGSGSEEGEDGEWEAVPPEAMRPQGAGPGPASPPGPAGPLGPFGRGSRAWRREERDIVMSSKLEALAMEYNYLLTSQLESQRVWFEERAAREACELAAAAPPPRTRPAARRAGEGRGAAEERAAGAEKERRALERRVQLLQRKAEAAAKEAAFAKQLNEQLLANQAELRAALDAEKAAAAAREAALQKQVSELSEQVRDLMFYMTAQQTIAQSPDAADIQGGTVAVPEPEARLRGRRRGAGAGRR
eukprot:tig00021238_g19547.t1